MIRRNRNPKTMTTSPATAWVNVPFADSVCLGSPDDVKYLKPPIVNIINKTIPARETAIVKRLATTHSNPFIVATVPNSQKGFIELQSFVCAETKEVFAIRARRAKGSAFKKRLTAELFIHELYLLLSR